MPLQARLKQPLRLFAPREFLHSPIPAPHLHSPAKNLLILHKEDLPVSTFENTPQVYRNTPTSLLLALLFLPIP